MAFIAPNNSAWKAFFNPVGSAKQSKEKIETIDDDNKIIKFSLFGGNVSENYKSLKAILQVIHKEDGSGIVKWTYEYEKLKQDLTIASPNAHLDFSAKVTKEIDAHIVME